MVGQEFVQSDAGQSRVKKCPAFRAIKRRVMGFLKEFEKILSVPEISRIGIKFLPRERICVFNEKLFDAFSRSDMIHQFIIRLSLLQRDIVIIAEVHSDQGERGDLQSGRRENPGSCPDRAAGIQTRQPIHRINLPGQAVLLPGIVNQGVPPIHVESGFLKTGDDIARGG